MKLSNIPTDNLYKFMAIFGLVLVVFNSFMFNQTINNAYKFEDDLNAKASFYRIDSLGNYSLDSISIAKAKVQIEKDYKQYKRILKKIPHVLAGVLTSEQNLPSRPRWCLHQ